jgi:hypothetical protein
MNINILNGITKEYSSMNLCVNFSMKDRNLHVNIIQYANDGNEFNFECESYVVFPIKGYSSNITLESDIPLYGNDEEEIGIICIPSAQELSLFSGLTNAMIICLIMDYSLLEDEHSAREVFLGKIDFPQSNEYLISSSCVLVECQFSDDYDLKYKNSSAIWGGFTHDDLRTSYKKTVRSLSVIDKIEIPTNEHQMKLSESIFSSNGFDRFLKKYHLLELLYDYLYIAKLRTVDNGLLEYRCILGEYSKDDIVNLKKMFSLYVIDVRNILAIILSSIEFKSKMHIIFQIHSKDSNPLKNEIDWNKFWNFIDTENFSDENYRNKQYKIGKKSLNEIVLDICAYWIYRVRCSIAHNKIGEFIFSPCDEKFIVDFAERIIDIISAQVFSNSDLNVLLNKSKSIDEFLNAS